MVLVGFDQVDAKFDVDGVWVGTLTYVVRTASLSEDWSTNCLLLGASSKGDYNVPFGSLMAIK
jgi:hypothetical protein